MLLHGIGLLDDGPGTLELAAGVLTGRAPACFCARSFRCALYMRARVTLGGPSQRGGVRWPSRWNLTFCLAAHIQVYKLEAPQIWPYAACRSAGRHVPDQRA
jgi:hypothetical protein